MKFSKEVLLEIVHHVQDGLLNGKDISENLRTLDVVVNNEELVLSQSYRDANPRAAVWVEDESAEA